MVKPNGDPFPIFRFSDFPIFRPSRPPVQPRPIRIPWGPFAVGSVGPPKLARHHRALRGSITRAQHHGSHGFHRSGSSLRAIVILCLNMMFGCVHVKAVSWVAILEQKTGKAGGLRSGSFVSVRVHSWFHCAEPFRDASRLSAHPRQSVWIRG